MKALIYSDNEQRSGGRTGRHHREADSVRRSFYGAVLFWEQVPGGCQENRLGDTVCIRRKTFHGRKSKNC